MRFFGSLIKTFTALSLLMLGISSLAGPPDPNPQHIYWGAWQIHRANLDGTGDTQVADPGGPYGSFLVNRAADRLYIVDGYHLWSTNLAGGNVQTVFSFPSDFYNPDVALDPKRNRLYVNDEVRGAIYRVDATGQAPLQIVPPQSGALHIEELDFDPIGDKLYWLQWPSAFGMQFHRSNPDGSGIENLFSVNANVSDFALDLGSGKIYWTEFGRLAGEGGVYRANLNGTSRQSLVSGLWGVAGIALDIPRNKLYFSDHWTAYTPHYDGKIYTANLDGSNLQTLVNLGPADSTIPYSVGLDPLFIPEPTGIALFSIAAVILGGSRLKRSS